MLPSVKYLVKAFINKLLWWYGDGSNRVRSPPFTSGLSIERGR
jgi:hypothetical protein